MFMMNILKLLAINYKIHDKPILEDISLMLRDGECIAIMGGNGSGKSTLLKIIAGLLTPMEGEVHSNVKRIGYIPEQPPKLRLTAMEYLNHMGKIQGLSTNRLYNRIEILIEKFGLEDYQHLRMDKLSKGNKQKVMLIQALLGNPDLLLLDEPLSGLDPDAQGQLLKILQQLKQAGTAIIFTCHEVYLSDQLADRHLCIANRNLIKLAAKDETRKKFRQIEFTMRDTEENTSWVKNSLDFVVYNQHDSTHIIVVDAEKRNEVIREILLHQGLIKFVSHELDSIPKIGNDKRTGEA